MLKSVLDLDERELVTSPRASPKEARPTSPRVRSLEDARVQRLSVPGSTPTRLNPPRDRREETKSDTLDCSDCSFDDKMSLATATARVAPATPARCSRRACSCECAVHTRSAACSRRAARSGASLAPTRGSVRRGKPLTRMSATPGKNAPVATEDAPEMDRAVFAAATGLFSPVGTSPRDRSRAHPDSSPPEARPRTPPPRVSLPRTNTSPDVSAATFRRLDDADVGSRDIRSRLFAAAAGFPRSLVRAAADAPPPSPSASPSLSGTPHQSCPPLPRTPSPRSAPRSAAPRACWTRRTARRSPANPATISASSASSATRGGG